MNKIDNQTVAHAPPSHRQISVGNRIPELDGARGIAVLLVVVGHYFGEVESGFLGLWPGWIGVTLFFVALWIVDRLHHSRAQRQSKFPIGLLCETR